MAYLIILRSISESKGDLTVIEKEIPFEPKRVFFIYNSDGHIRGSHKHYDLIEAVVCINGSCSITIDDKETFILDSPNKCLVIEPKDWRVLHSFINDAKLVVLASNIYDKTDYIFEK